MTTPGRTENGSPSRDMFDSLVVATAVIAGALSTGWPENPGQWTLLAIAAAFGGLAPHGPLGDLLRAAAWQLLRGVRSVGLRRLLVWSTVVVTAAGLGRALVTAGPEAAAWVDARVFGCGNPTELRVLSTPEGLATASELAAGFERYAAAENNGCAAVNLYVYAQPPAVARAALASGWSTNHLSALGPRPDVWLPGSGQYALTDPNSTSRGLLPSAVSTSIASTPVVLALPTNVVPAQLALGRADSTWAETFAVVKRVGWGLARADPSLSAAGMLSTVAMYAGGNDPRRLANPGDSDIAVIDRGQAREIETRIAEGMSRGGYPLGNDADLLCRHRQQSAQADIGPEEPARPTRRASINALIITEQQLVRFNAGFPLGGQCASRVEAQPTEERLFAIYPPDTLGLDYPFVRLDWPRRSTGQRHWVAEFASWLRTDTGRRALNDAGLRPPSWTVGEPLTERHGVLPGVSYADVAPHADVVAEVRELQTAVQRPGRVLLAVDASGSMRAAASPDGRSRFAVATDGVAASLSMLAGHDEFGLWVFQGNGGPPRQLVPMGQGQSSVGGLSRKDAASRALRAVRPGGNTPLYVTIVDGVTALRSTATDRVNALVVLTDGEDHGSGPSRAEVVRAARGAKVRVFVVAVGEANCHAQAIRDITGASAGSCVEADFSNIDTRLEELFRTLWGGS